MFDLQRICLPWRLTIAEKNSSHLAQAEHQNDDCPFTPGQRQSSLMQGTVLLKIAKRCK